MSVNKIAQRAGLAVGTLHRYHKTKDDLLFAVFLEVKRDIHRAMMAAAGDLAGPAERLRAMWFALVNYGFDAPHDFLFVKMMSAEIREPFLSDPDLQKMQTEVLAEIDQKILVDTPATLIETVLASPAITLARRASLSGRRSDKSELESLFALIWRGIARGN